MAPKDTRRALVWTEAGVERTQALPERGSLTIGSAPGEGQVLRLDAPGVDDAHCVIGRTKSGVHAIKDLGSLTGTLLNGEPTPGARLRAGDRITVGGVELAFVGLDADGRPERPAAPTRPTAAAPSTSAARRMGGFRIEERLGRGGMGEVLAAVQESLDRKVALKLLNPKLAADQDFVGRFQAEARAAAALNHPNVVHVYDVGVVDGQHYLAMEFMAGGTLETRVAAEGALPVAEVQRVLEQATQALVYAEERGIVHRDIKPDNLMLDGAGTVKLADLGLATTIEAEHREDRILGTPHFMAPEQARGGKVDHRSDLYALGATAFRLLTGETVFAGETTRDILRAAFTEEPRRPSDVRPGVPAALDEVVLRLLRKDPAERYGSARELAAALAALGPADTAAPAGGSKVLPLALGGVVVVGAVVAAVLLGGGDEPDPDPGGGSAPVMAGPGGPDGPGDDLPEVPALPTVATGGPETPVDDDRVLEDLERLARQAYGGLAPITDPTSRKAALEELAASFPGTTVATEALAEVAALTEELAGAAAAEAARAAEQERLLAGLAMLVSEAPRLPDGGPADPAGLARTLLDATAPSEPALAQAFEAERLAKLTGVVDAARAHATAELERAEALAAVGDFDGYQTTLEALLPYFDEAALQPEPTEDGVPPSAPGLPAGGIGGGAGTPDVDEAADALEDPIQRSLRPQDGPVLPERLAEELEAALAQDAGVVQVLGDPADGDLLRRAGWSDFQALADLAAERLAARPAREAAFRAAEAAADRAALAGGLDSLGDDLAGLDLAAAAARLDALAGSLATDAARDAVGRLARETRLAAEALDLLVTSHGSADDGGWRRDSVPDPAGGYLDALDVDAVGITVDGGDGGRLVPWSSYGGDPRMIDLLFKNRLRRDYTGEERLGIAALARYGAVLTAIDEADRVLVPSDRERFGLAEERDLLVAFEVGAAWSTAPEAAAADERELAAAETLARALLSRTAGDPAAAAARLEELLDDHAHSLLVLLLSDGRGPAPAGSDR